MSATQSKRRLPEAGYQKMMRLLLTWTSLAAGLVACGGLEAEGNVGGAMETPEIVQEMIAADFPADGRIHLHTEGKFQLGPKILFCEADASVDPEIKELGITGMGIDGVKLAEAIRALGQSDYLDGSPRQRTLRSGHCSDDGTNIIYRGHALLNRSGDPYKLVLSVWQGDPSRGGAAWVGAVERLEGRRPDVSTGFPDPPMGDEPRITREVLDRRHTELSIIRDVQDISQRFADLVASNEKPI